MSRESRVIVALHAHPDDESLLTGGTLAKAVRQGHRVVVITCTDGEAGLTAPDQSGPGLASVRSQELAEAVATLGCHRLVRLGYADSGSSPGEPGPGSFASLDPVGPAAEVAGVLIEEGADLLISYDARGGYGHPDHVQVHRVGALAAKLARTPLVWEATVDRRAMAMLGRVLARLPGLRGMLPPGGLRAAGSDQVTHVVDVRREVRIKQAALRAHSSQATGGPRGTPRTVRLLAGLPWPVSHWVLGREWFRAVASGSGD